MKPSFFLKTFLPVFAAIILVAGIAYSVWTEPTAAPPGNNVEAPINTGATAQTKAGAMYSNDRVGAPNLCIGTDCRNIWPSGGGPCRCSIYGSGGGGRGVFCSTGYASCPWGTWATWQVCGAFSRAGWGSGGGYSGWWYCAP